MTLGTSPHWTQQHCTLVSCLHHGDSIIIVITNPSNAIALTRTYFIYPQFSLDTIDAYSYIKRKIQFRIETVCEQMLIHSAGAGCRAVVVLAQSVSVSPPF